MSTVIFLAPRPFWLTMDHMSSTLLLSSVLCSQSPLTQSYTRGIFVTSYLSYFRSVLLSLFPQFGLTHFVALRQHVWSRYAGAPAWAPEHAGFDLYGLEDVT